MSVFIANMLWGLNYSFGFGSFSRNFIYTSFVTLYILSDIHVSNIYMYTNIYIYTDMDIQNTNL